MKQQSWILDGEKVSGLYYGNAFSGVVRESRVKYGGSVQYTVDLDQPIQLRWRSEPKSVILVDAIEIQSARS